jgi:PAT family beta-lactamase induction signal transducer AmpG
MLTGNGLIVIIGGYLEQEYGDKQKAWSYTMIIVGLIMAALTIYNYFFYTENRRRQRRREIVGTQSKFWSRLCQFFKKNKLGSYWPLYYYSAWANPSY